METILQLSRHMSSHSHNSSSPSPMDMKYSPTESLKLSRDHRDNKRIERRKPNWTEAENVFLLDQFGIHRDILTCKATDASTNLKKQEIWRLICQNLNTHNTLVRRTPAEVRRKWKNLVTAAKKEVWEMRHQIHLSGGSGANNGRKISELSQRVLQLHSSGGFSSANPNGLYGTLLSAGLIGPPGGISINSINKYDSDDKSYIPAHFTPIITLSESNNNHISLMSQGDGPPSPLSDEDQDQDVDDDMSSDSRNATEFMSDSGIYEQEGIDLRVNVMGRSVGNSGNGGSGVNLSNLQNLSNFGGIGNLGGLANGMNGRHVNNLKSINHISRQLMLKNSVGDEDEEEEDCDDDDPVGIGHGVGVGEMNLIRFASQLGLRELGKIGKVPMPTIPQNQGNPYISSALFNQNNHNSVKNERADRADRDRGDRPGDRIDKVNQESGRKNSETEEISPISLQALNGELLDTSLKLRQHFLNSLKESNNSDSSHLTNLYRERLELQIEVLKLRKQKLNQELKMTINTTTANTNNSNTNNNRNKRLNFSQKFNSNGLNGQNGYRSKERRRNNSYFRLKPKNTWINFANKEKLLSKKEEEKVGLVNGNCNGESDHLDDEKLD